MIKNVFVLSISLIILCASHVWGTDYYVRPSGGDYGAEDGSSYAAAWDGFTNINWSTVDAGNGTLYVAGTHNEQLSIDTSGEDGTPIYVASCTIANGASTDDAGIIDGEDGTSATYGVTIGFTTPSSWVTIDGLTITEADRDGIFFEDGAGTVIKNCTITDILALVSSSGYGNGIRIYEPNDSGITFDIYNNTITNVAQHGIVFAKTTTVANVTGSSVYENTISQCANGGIAINLASYLDIYRNTVSNVSNTGNYNGIGLLQSSYCEIYDNTVYDVNGAGTDSACLRTMQGSYNKFYNNNISDATTCIHIDNSSDNTNEGTCAASDSTGNEFYYNILNNCQEGIYFEQANVNSTAYNNTVYGCGNAFIKTGNCSIYASGNLIKNNIFWGHAETAACVIWGDETGYAMDYNLYYDATGTTFTWYHDDNPASGGTVKTYCASGCDGTWTTWKTDFSPWEANSPTPADPLFVSAGTDFHLTSTSPAKDVGTDVSLTADYDGINVPQGAGFDIGAYEYLGTTYIQGASTMDGVTVQ